MKAMLVLRTADHLLTTHGSATWPVWQQLLRVGAASSASWQPDWQAIRIRVPVLVGNHGLSLARMKALGVGDIVLPRQPLFDVSGRGQLRIGAWLVEVQSGDGHILEVIEVYPSTNLEPGDAAWDTHPAEADDHDTPSGDLSPLSSVPVNLQFELGQVSMSLGEMQSLAVGSIIRMQAQATPPHVSIRAGGQVVGQGELLDVDGQLGIQIMSWAGK